MKYAVFLLLVTIPAVAARMECVRWTWYGDVYNRTVICLEWRDRDAPDIKKVPKDEKRK
jgi:hypothetical protein